MNVLKQLAFRALPAAIAGVCFLALPALQSVRSQTKNESAGSIQKTRRTFPFTKFYDTPSLTPGSPGDLIRSEQFDEYDLPFDVLAVRILYHSRSANGQDIPASGVVLYPDAKPPAGGWPIIAWAHALNGVARQCAPSLARNLQHGPFLSMYVKLGFAVVATDYAGLGTAVRNAFSDAPSNASDVIYSVPAARAAVPGLNSRWLAIGIGEGGAAVVALDELERDMHDPSYLGSLAISGLDDPPTRHPPVGSSNPHPMPFFLAYGVKTIYPDLRVQEVLTDKALPFYAKVEQSCREPAEESAIRASGMLKSDWAANPFVGQYFSRSSLGRKPAQAPLLVITTDRDLTVPISTTSQVIARMCKQGDHVEFNQYPQSEAANVFGDSVRDQISWIQARFAGRRDESNCSDQH